MIMSDAMLEGCISMLEKRASGQPSALRNQTCMEVQRGAKLLKEREAAAWVERAAAAAAAAEDLKQRLLDARAAAQEQVDLLRRQLQSTAAAAAATAGTAAAARMTQAAAQQVRNSSVARRSSQEQQQQQVATLSSSAATLQEQQQKGLFEAASKAAEAAKREAAAARAQPAELSVTVESLRDELRKERLAHPSGPSAFLLPPNAGDSPYGRLDTPHCAVGNSSSSSSRPATAAAHQPSSRPTSGWGPRGCGSRPASAAATVETRPAALGGDLFTSAVRWPGSGTVSFEKQQQQQQ
jgi:hypothetical protein